ncbi:hypothetical protein BANRA_02751 [Acinetobacter baumannii]|nr:hypothetical protein BANRA_02751 [Acinetobacter baumannii]
MDAGKFLTGAFNTAAQYFERWGAAVQIGMQGDDFTSNKRTLLAETRGALVFISLNRLYMALILLLRVVNSFWGGVRHHPF